MINTRARNPLLFDLFAQSTLGRIKDMKSCTCEVRDADTGLKQGFCFVSLAPLRVNYSGALGTSKTLSLSHQVGPYPAPRVLCILARPSGAHLGPKEEYS